MFPFGALVHIAFLIKCSASSLVPLRDGGGGGDFSPQAALLVLELLFCHLYYFVFSQILQIIFKN